MLELFLDMCLHKQDGLRRRILYDMCTVHNSACNILCSHNTLTNANDIDKTMRYCRLLASPPLSSPFHSKKLRLCHIPAVARKFHSQHTAAVPQSWLSDLKTRMGKCIVFGLQPVQLDEAGDILRIVAEKWRELVAGSEGFLVGHRREGLEGQLFVGDGIVSVGFSHPLQTPNWGDKISCFPNRAL